MNNNNNNTKNKNNNNNNNNKMLAHLLIQKGRILVPKIRAWNEIDGGGQIIAALICEKLTIKHI